MAAKQSLPSLPRAGWAALAVALLGGLLVGNRLSQRLDPVLAMRIVMIVALAGASIALLRGVLELI